eukprot:scaffold198294_cov45-Prasinocladus_malaysianus.AAC.1
MFSPANASTSRGVSNQNSFVATCSAIVNQLAASAASHASDQTPTSQWSELDLTELIDSVGECWADGEQGPCVES